MKKSLLFFLSFALTACGSAATPIPQKTLTPTLTATPTATPTPTPTLTTTPPPNGPCDNPLVPLGTGNQWTYRVTTTGGEARYSLKSLGRQDGANIVALVEYSDQKNSLTVQDLVVCQDGAIDNYPLFVMNMLFSDYLNKYIDTYHESGPYAPNDQSLIQNNWRMTWQADYLTEDEAYIKNPLGGPDLLIMQSTPVGLSFQMDGSRESVTTPAGNFPQALKIIQDFSLNVTITVPGSGTGTGDTLTLHTTQWYEPYIGLVRAQVESASLSGDGMEYRVPLESTLELVEFAPIN
jgi:hypothetical protein